MALDSNTDLPSAMTAYLTPEQIRQKYEYANLLRQQSLEPVKHPLGIAARVAQALAGGLEVNKLDEAQRNKQQGLAQLYASLSPRAAGETVTASEASPGPAGAPAPATAHPMGAGVPIAPEDTITPRQVDMANGPKTAAAPAAGATDAPSPGNLFSNATSVEVLDKDTGRPIDSGTFNKDNSIDWKSGAPSDNSVPTQPQRMAAVSPTAPTAVPTAPPPPPSGADRVVQALQPKQVGSPTFGPDPGQIGAMGAMLGMSPADITQILNIRTGLQPQYPKDDYGNIWEVRTGRPPVLVQKGQGKFGTFSPVKGVEIPYMENIDPSTMQLTRYPVDPTTLQRLPSTGSSGGGGGPQVPANVVSAGGQDLQSYITATGKSPDEYVTDLRARANDRDRQGDGRGASGDRNIADAVAEAIRQNNVAGPARANASSGPTAGVHEDMPKMPAWNAPVQDWVTYRHRMDAWEKGEEARQKKVSEERVGIAYEPIKEDIKHGNQAQDTLNVLNRMYDAYKAGKGSINGGPMGEFMLQLKQLGHQVIGGDWKGLQEGEIIRKSTTELATALMKEISSRGGTQMEFARILENNPGIMMSDKGALYMIDLLRQQAKLKQRLASEIAVKNTDPDHYPQQRIDFYNRPENALISPITGKPLGGGNIEKDLAELRGTRDQYWADQEKNKDKLEAEARKRGLIK